MTVHIIKKGMEVFNIACPINIDFFLKMRDWDHYRRCRIDFITDEAIRFHFLKKECRQFGEQRMTLEFFNKYLFENDNGMFVRETYDIEIEI